MYGTTGFRYLIPNGPPEPTASTVTEDTVGSGTPATYGVTASAVGSGQSVEDQYVNSLPKPAQATYNAAFDGPANQNASIRLPSGRALSYTTGGCLGVSRTQLYGSVAAMMAVELVPPDVENLFGTFLNTDTVYQSALTAWQRCMAAAGWPSHTPENAIQSLRTLAAQGTDATRLTGQQTAIATADVTCDRSSQLRAHPATQRLAVLRTRPAALVNELAALYAARTAAYARAAKVLP
ncbi:MAG TPA: hypothetical protein VHW44_01690 [Pseudonocardiaceae bacterium]|nr:hypothetical protein [Pseudonocardiaceae bacterium]